MWKDFKEWSCKTTSVGGLVLISAQRFTLHPVGGWWYYNINIDVMKTNNHSIQIWFFLLELLNRNSLKNRKLIYSDVIVQRSQSRVSSYFSAGSVVWSSSLWCSVCGLYSAVITDSYLLLLKCQESELFSDWTSWAFKPVWAAVDLNWLVRSSQPNAATSDPDGWCPVNETTTVEFISFCSLFNKTQRHSFVLSMWGRVSTERWRCRLMCSWSHFTFIFKKKKNRSGEDNDLVSLR